MSWQKRKLFSVIAALMWIGGCGVKGDPLPPERPVELGRGRPTYKRATEGLKIEKNKPPRARPADRDDEDEDGED